ncbi:MAG: hypothetical protein KJ648_07695 [Candidatus Omnitrophica bacterium]|nr:hypothetical protein [Candidatus Omnitrophota bacterium]
MALTEKEEQEYHQLLEIEYKENRDIKPETDNILWQYIKAYFNFEVPNVAVCEGHCSPFSFLADIFFERVTNAFGFANRGSGKTRDVSIIHQLNSHFKPGCDTASVGAIEHQAEKCYQYLQEYLHPVRGQFADTIVTTRKGDTEYENGSKLEILPATINALNAPHPAKAFLDEVELVDWSIFQEFLNMAHSQKDIKAQNILTSTRKWLYGTVQKILDERQFKVYLWCIFEIAQECKNDCRDCSKFIKGAWEDGRPRTFKSVCKERMRKSRGFLSFEDVINRFLTLDRVTWEAQQECTKPGRVGLVHQWFDEQKHIRELPYNPQLPLYEAIDWGGTNPFCCLWIQETHEPKILEIDELYIANIAPSTFAKMIKDRRSEMGYDVYETFGDPTGKDCILEFLKAGITVKTKTAEVGPSIQEVIKWGEDNLILTDPRCRNLIAERNNYRWPTGKSGKNLDEKPTKEFDHAMDSERIYFINRFMKGRRDEPGSFGNPDRGTHAGGSGRLFQAGGGRLF